MKRLRNLLCGKFAPVSLMILITAGISFITRVVLLVYSGSSFDFTFLNIIGVFGIGLFYDLCMCSFFIIPIVLHIWFTNEKMYKTPGKWISIGFYLLLIIAIAFFKIIPVEYNKLIPVVVLLLVVIRFLIYLLLLYKGEFFRLKWRNIVLLADVFLLTYFLFFNAVSEYFFWNEFGSRYNFIAVDYLVYTNEVIGNINQSYPIGWISAGVLLATLPIIIFSRRLIKQSVYKKTSFVKRTITALVFFSFTALVYFGITNQYRKFSANQYANELAGNGLYEFGAAFLNNELDFYKFYKTIPDTAAFAIVRKQLQAPNAKFVSNDIFNLERDISYDEPEKKYNIVLISVESFSASFMKAFGETRNLTPNLDSLAQHSIFFTNLYATGTRTVRGLESLSLSIPPLPGESVVRWPNNENLFSVGALLKSKGYITQFIYGGYSSFDNMGYYFSHNNYEVIDRTAIPSNEIHYENIWGVADEDLFTLALNKLDADYVTGKPFFSHIMTTSNHRPFTYPEGRIDISPSTQSREGGVKYTDYAIGRFIKEASTKPWFSNTIFVIVADHCAYAAGKVELPVTGYHIPMLVYSPALIKPETYNRLTSQMDIVPTMLGLLKMNYRSKFFGEDIFSLPEGKERAFISTYQGLGYLRNGELVILRPPKQVDQYIPDFTTGKATKTQLNDSLVNQAIAYYQTAAWILKNKKFGEK